MAVNLSTPGSCCGHDLNHHISEDDGPGRPCLVCSCLAFVPDLCHYGHEAGCEHMVDPDKRCKATLSRPGLPGRLRCTEEHKANGIAFIWHRARHPISEDLVSWSEQEAEYPMTNSDHDAAAERVFALPDRVITVDRELNAEEVVELKEKVNRAVRPKFETKDSGERAEYDSGMVRDSVAGKAKFELLLPLGVPYSEQFLVRVAELLARGAEKYDDRNWERAQGEEELERFKSSALRHLMQWAAGEVDEDHAAAVVFNLLAYETTKWRRNH